MGAHKVVLLAAILVLSSWTEVLATSTPTPPLSLPVPRRGCSCTLSEVWGLALIRLDTHPSGVWQDSYLC